MVSKDTAQLLPLLKPVFKLNTKSFRVTLTNLRIDKKIFVVRRQDAGKGNPW